MLLSSSPSFLLLLFSLALLLLLSLNYMFCGSVDPADGCIAQTAPYLLSARTRQLTTDITEGMKQTWPDTRQDPIWSLHDSLDMQIRQRDGKPVGCRERSNQTDRDRKPVGDWGGGGGGGAPDGPGPNERATPSAF